VGESLGWRPQAPEALLACRSLPGVHQSVLTGNVYPLAELKLTAFGLVEHLDLRIGAFGGDALERVELPAHASRRARQRLAFVDAVARPHRPGAHSWTQP
jgi:phosphoglycolate phosphatase